MTMTVAFVTVLLLALVARVVPLLLSPHGAGIDHWYWKAYIDALTRDRQFPPSMPQYVLEEHQWYPPLFPLLLARLPKAVFEQFDTVIAVGIDLVRMLVLLVSAALRTQDAGVVFMAGLLYATTPIQVAYNIQLNPRGLAALMLDTVLILMLVQLDPGGAVSGSRLWLWALVAGVSGLILLTHKMTTQLFWFVVVGTAIIYREWPLLWLIPASIGAALLISRGFYRNVLRAHWDIVTFWNRNWPWIGADPLRESPLYGEPGYERPEKLHRKGVRGVARQLATLFGFNPAAWIGCLLVYERLWVTSPVLFFPTYLLVWLLLPCMLALLTTFVRPLKCLGAGYLYLYNTSLLTSLLLGTAYTETRIPDVSKPFILGALLCNVVAVLIYYRHFLGNRRQRVDEGLDGVLDTLRTLPRGVVMCFPANWYEVVAYKAGQPVLWGGHGYGFKRLEPTWPRVQIPMADILRRYGVKYLLTMDGMLTPRFAADLPASTRISRGEYHLYCFDADDAPARPAAASTSVLNPA